LSHRSRSGRYPRHRRLLPRRPIPIVFQADQPPRNYYRSDLDWTSWSKRASEAVDRSYNYPHVAAAHWTLYHLARNNPGLATLHPWSWYLTHAYETSVAMTTFAPDLSQFGQMEGDIFVQILTDLKREGMKTEADTLETEVATIRQG